MELIDEPLPGVKILRPFVFDDSRGNFVKPFHDGQLAAHGIHLNLREEFYTTSNANVIRGMHFQAPPHDHQKLVYCISGKVLDVLLDLRKTSATYGQHARFEVSAENKHVVYIPIGFAHGFLSLEDHSCLVYKTDTVHHPSSDRGIRWNSFGCPWPNQSAASLSISARDELHPPFAEFVSPF
jgi:dTDP-4-dehydrorhamnose 3,5-epimerase/CDP-3, 6-dideoxy-D-glycero-D-glycero-4-hexulose-5-epimerase